MPLMDRKSTFLRVPVWPWRSASWKGARWIEWSHQAGPAGATSSLLTWTNLGGGGGRGGRIVQMVTKGPRRSGEGGSEGERDEASVTV